MSSKPRGAIIPMQKAACYFLLSLLMAILNITHASETAKGCCAAKNGISYCDSSGGRYVCNDGSYSQCLCRPSAPMDLQALKGCCLWNGGVFKEVNGDVICNDLTVSRVCSIQTSNQNFGFY